MPVITFDSCIFITYQPSYLPKGFRLTAVVLQELTAGADDDKEVKYWNDVRRAREKDETLIVPNGEDWWEKFLILCKEPCVAVSKGKSLNQMR